MSQQSFTVAKTLKYTINRKSGDYKIVALLYNNDRPKTERLLFMSHCLFEFLYNLKISVFRFTVIITSA